MNINILLEKASTCIVFGTRICLVISLAIYFTSCSTSYIYDSDLPNSSLITAKGFEGKWKYMEGNREICLLFDRDNGQCIYHADKKYADGELLIDYMGVTRISNSYDSKYNISFSSYSQKLNKYISFSLKANLFKIASDTFLCVKFDDQSLQEIPESGLYNTYKWAKLLSAVEFGNLFFLVAQRDNKIFIWLLNGDNNSKSLRSPEDLRKYFEANMNESWFGIEPNYVMKKND